MPKIALKQISRLPGASSPTIKKSPLHPQVKTAQAIASAIKQSTSYTEARNVSRTVTPNLPGKGKLGSVRFPVWGSMPGSDRRMASAMRDLKKKPNKK